MKDSPHPLMQQSKNIIYEWCQNNLIEDGRQHIWVSYTAEQSNGDGVLSATVTSGPA